MRILQQIFPFLTILKINQVIFEKKPIFFKEKPKLRTFWETLLF